MTEQGPHKNASVYLFALKVLLLLVPCLALWYLSSPLVLPMKAMLAQGVLHWLFENRIEDMLIKGMDFHIVANIVTEQGQARKIAVVVEPLSLEFGSALVLALLLASPGPDRLENCILGYGMVQAFAVCAIVIQTIATVELSFPHQLLPDLIPSQAFVLAWHTIALAFNAVFPVMIWMLLQRDFFRRLTGGCDPATPVRSK